MPCPVILNAEWVILLSEFDFAKTYCNFAGWQNGALEKQYGSSQLLAGSISSSCRDFFTAYFMS